VLELVRSYPGALQELAAKINEADLPTLTKAFLSEQLGIDGMPAGFLPYTIDVKVFHSAIAIFFAPSDPSGVCSMWRERIWATPSWWEGEPRYDTVFVVKDNERPGMCELNVAHIWTFFSFVYNDVVFPCAFVEWFTTVSMDSITGMWVVHPDYICNRCHKAVIHLDAILRAAHLIPIYGRNPLPIQINSVVSLDTFKAYYINKYIDYHAHKITFWYSFCTT
jgi:hypothetical protein